MSDKKWISSQLCIAEASFTCNLYCEYCHNPPDGKRYFVDDILDLVKKEKPYAVSLEGRGEPLVNPNILDLIKKIKKMGVKYISISTNGIALSDKIFAKELSKNVDFFIVNFPSHIKEIYNEITRSVKYDLIINSFENLKKLNLLNKVRVFHIINKKNYIYLGEFVDWINANYGDVFLLNFCYVRNKGRVNNNKKIIPKYCETSKFIKLALAKAKLYGIKTIVQNVPLCILEGFEGFSFEFHRYKRGDSVFESGVELPLNLKICQKCSLKPACCGARKDYVSVYGDKELKTSKKDINLIKEERF